MACITLFDYKIRESKFLNFLSCCQHLNALRNIKMDFVDLIKLIHDNVKKTSKWNEENIKKVLVKCNHLHELNELLLFCKYEDRSFVEGRF